MYKILLLADYQELNITKIQTLSNSLVLCDKITCDLLMMDIRSEIKSSKVTFDPYCFFFSLLILSYTFFPIKKWDVIYILCRVKNKNTPTINILNLFVNFYGKLSFWQKYTDALDSRWIRINSKSHISWMIWSHQRPCHWIQKNIREKKKQT